MFNMKLEVLISDFGNELITGPIIELEQNPVSSAAIILNLHLGVDIVTDFALYDASGQRVAYYNDVNLGASAGNTRLPIPSLPAGVYFLKALDLESFSAAKVIILK